MWHFTKYRTTDVLVGGHGHHLAQGDKIMLGDALEGQAALWVPGPCHSHQHWAGTQSCTQAGGERAEGVTGAAASRRFAAASFRLGSN